MSDFDFCLQNLKDAGGKLKLDWKHLVYQAPSKAVATFSQNETL